MTDDTISWAPARGIDRRGDYPAEAFSNPFEVSWFTLPPGPARPPDVKAELVGLAAVLVGQARAGLGRDQLDAHATRALAEQIVELVDAGLSVRGPGDDAHR
jgi:hypothetical protein